MTNENEPDRTEEAEPKTVPALLTPRQSEVLELMAAGLTNPEIAERLEPPVGLDAAKVHVRDILYRLDVRNRLEAVNRAYELQLIDQEGIAALRRRLGDFPPPVRMNPSWKRVKKAPEKS